MANNNEKESYANSLKASFCRQLFPELIQFLTDFDISEQQGKLPNDSLNMHFMLQAYDYIDMSNAIKKIEDPIAQNEEHQKVINALKEVCKWKLSDVSETDVLIAIDEFFDITSQTEEMSQLRDALIKKATFPGTHLEEWKFVDMTTKSIINYFGIELGNKDEIGHQRQAFSDFVKCARNIVLDKGTSEIAAESSYYDQYEELRFTNAFRLFRCLRNWWGHDIEGFTNDEFIRYYRFILYTQIGLVYVSRRLWKKYKENLETKYTTPPSKELEAEIINVELIADKKNEIISECEYQIEGSDPIPQKDLKGNKVTFEINVPKYTPFTIRFQCEAYSYEITRKMNYYAWNPTLTITVQPPAKIHCSFKGIAGSDESLETIIGNLFTQYLGSYSNPKATNEQKETNEKILNQLAAIEPLLREIHGFAAKNEEKNDEIIARLNEEIDKLNNLDKRLEKIYGPTSDTTEGVREIKETLLSWEKTWKGVVIFFILLLIGYVYYQCLTNNLESNISWLRYRFFYIPLALLAIGLTFRLLTNTWNPRKAIKEKGQLKYWITGAVALLLLGSPFLFRYQSNKSLVEEYDFLGQDSICNRKVALYLEEQIPGDEEAIRSKLALYYTDIVGDLGKASQISSPLLNVDKYKEGSLAAMYVLYRQGEISSFQDYVELYGERYGEEDPAYCDLKGVMLLDTLYDERDVHKGMDYLLKAYEAGSMTACYNLGYLLSTDQSTMENEKLGKRAQNSHYDIPKAVRYLREASAFLPEASIQLADIYSDLQMKDSALFYYQKAIDDANNGMIRINGLYKLGIFLNKNGIKNDAVLSAQTMKYPPAFIFPAVAMDEDKNLINKSHSVYDYFLMLFKNKAHKKAIKRFEEIQRKESSLTLDEMGLYQYIPPVVFDYVYIGEREKALATLQKYRKEAHFDMTFIYSVEKLLGTATVPKDSIKAMQLMHESAAKGCVYSEMYCIFKDMVRDFANISLLKNAASRLHEISNIIPFAHVLESILLMESGNIEEGERAIHMAMWKKHPAGAFAFEFLPNKYHIDKLNKSKNADDSTLFVSRKLMEMSLRSTWSYKDNILVNVCYLDWLQHKRDKKNYKENFIFWSEVAIVSGSLSSQLKLLSIYEEMIKNGDVDKNERIIDNLIRSVLSNVMNGKFDNNTNTKCNNYLAWFLKNDSLVSPTYAQELFRFYGTTELLQSYEKAERNKRAKLPIVISLMDLHTIDDYSILNEFSYFAGPYSFEIAGNGGGITLFYRPDNR